MSEDNQQVDQITKEPEEKIERVKNPKKVAAGRRLAEYHKKAKKALQKDNDIDEEENNDSKWIPEISLTTALSLVGITLTATDLYFRWRKSNNQTPTPKSNIESEVLEKPIKKQVPQQITKPASQPSKIPRKIGME